MHNTTFKPYQKLGTKGEVPLTRLEVVVGSTLPLGLALTRRLSAEGRQVRALVLSAKRARGLFPESVEMMEIEPKRTSIQDACVDGSVVYDLFEPLSARQTKTCADVASAVLLAAIQSSAHVVIASHTFNSELDNLTMETDALATERSGFAKVVVARLPQIYGPGVRSPLIGSVCHEVLTKNTAHWLGDLDVPRSFVYIDDAVSALMLLQKTDSARGRVWNVAGPTPISGREFIKEAFASSGKTGNALVWGRGLMLTARLLDKRAREFLNLPYDYYASYVLDPEEFVSEFPDFEFTSNNVGIAATARWYIDNARETGSGGAQILVSDREQVGPAGN